VRRLPPLNLRQDLAPAGQSDALSLKRSVASMRRVKLLVCLGTPRALEWKLTRRRRVDRRGKAVGRKGEIPVE
jgi:hypothetical protein